MGGTPTFWDWLQLFLGLALFVYALLIFIGDRVPGMVKGSLILRRASAKVVLIFVDRVGGWLLDFYMGIAHGIRWLLLTLWRGPEPSPATAGSVNHSSQPAQPYVAQSPVGDAQVAQTEPVSVCLSADREPEKPAIPSALAALIIDSDLDKDTRKAATTKESLLCALIAAGWGYSEIRDVVKANNNTFPAEFEAAKQRLAQPTTPATTPIAGREVPAGVEFATK